MENELIRQVVDYIARNYRCTFPSAWDTGEGVQAPGRFAPPSEYDARQAIPRRDAIVEEITTALESKETLRWRAPVSAGDLKQIEDPQENDAVHLLGIDPMTGIPDTAIFRNGKWELMKFVEENPTRRIASALERIAKVLERHPPR